jgi:hypothetical protein
VTWGGPWSSPWGVLDAPIPWPPIEGETPAPILPGDLDAGETSQRATADYGRAGEVWGQLRGAIDDIAALADGANADVMRSRSVLFAYGAQLDAIGEAVGRPRGGLTDGLYRLAIAVRGSSLVGSGTTRQVSAIGVALGGEPLLVIDYYPAKVLVYADAGTFDAPLLGILQAELGDALADGVGLIDVLSLDGPLIEDPEDPFLFDESLMS